MEIINLTPHNITLIGAKNLKFTRAKKPARVQTKYVKDDENNVLSDNGNRMYIKKYIRTTNLPKPKKDTLYIVSSVIAVHHPNRNDLIVPYHIVKDKDNIPVGCLGFYRYSIDD